MRPSGKHQHAGMTLKGTGENFRALDTETNPVIFDRGNRCLGNARSLGQLVLAHLLELAKNPNRFSDAYGGPPLGGTIVFHQGLRWFTARSNALLGVSPSIESGWRSWS